MRTEAAYVRNQAALTRYRQNGRRKVRWITGESDGRECAVCRERDGQEYDIDAAPRLPAHPELPVLLRAGGGGGVDAAGWKWYNRIKQGKRFGDTETRLTKVIPPDRISNPMDLERYNKMREGLARQGISVVAAKGDDPSIFKGWHRSGSDLFSWIYHAYRRDSLSVRPVEEIIMQRKQNGTERCRNTT